MSICTLILLQIASDFYQDHNYGFDPYNADRDLQTFAQSLDVVRRRVTQCLTRNQVV